MSNTPDPEAKVVGVRICACKTANTNVENAKRLNQLMYYARLSPNCSATQCTSVRRHVVSVYFRIRVNKLDSLMEYCNKNNLQATSVVPNIN